MKLIDYINDFLTNTVNINQSRIDILSDRVAAVETFVKSGGTFKDHFIEVVAQGSYAHKTIIKPSEKKPEFDADILLYLTEVNDWQPKDYIDHLYSLFHTSGPYRDKASRQTRCVTVDYKGEFSMDVVPCIRREEIPLFETEHILNRLTNEEEATRPRAYTKWLLDQDKVIGSHQLVKVIRLAKYLRDIKQTFSVKSILLTTLLGMQVGLFDGIVIDDEFADPPTSLRTLFNRLDKWLQGRPEMPIVTNPVHKEEDFNRHWDQEKYSNFRDQWHKYTLWINEAYEEEDKQESIRKWRKVFGDDYAKGASTEGTAVAVAAKQLTPAHCEEPLWPVQELASVRLRATVHRDKDGTTLAELPNNAKALDKDLWLRFEVLDKYNAEIRFHWQVVNTGEEAERAGDLRGKIALGDQVHWERTKYRGQHWIECFAVNWKLGRKGICVGRSGRFLVNIK